MIVVVCVVCVVRGTRRCGSIRCSDVAPVIHLKGEYRDNLDGPSIDLDTVDENLVV